MSLLLLLLLLLCLRVPFKTLSNGSFRIHPITKKELYIKGFLLPSYAGKIFENLI